LQRDIDSRSIFQPRSLGDSKIRNPVEPLFEENLEWGLIFAWVPCSLGSSSIVTIIDIQNAEEALALVGSDKARFEKCDLSDGDEIRAVVAKTERLVGGTDILVHCAAHQPRRPFEEISVAQWRTTLSVNLDGLFHLAQAVVPSMKKSGWGRIVSFTSSIFNEGTPKHLDYVSSKAGIIGATRVLAKELGKHGITVNALSPGLVKTTTSAKAVEEMLAMGYPTTLKCI
jgi:NAD(P)-dependent dehydrogenase (short-subunit alcohol dehydrogenase family)